MASLVIKFADLASEPIGTGRDVDAEVLVSYTREVPLTDGTVLQAVPMRKQLGPGGTAIFEVTPSDDPTVVEAHRDFGLRVEWLLTHRAGRGRQTETRGARTVKVTAADGATVQFGTLLPIEPVPAKYTSVADFADDLEAQVGAAVGDATQALTAAQAARADAASSASDAADAATRAENAEGVALAPAAEVIADTMSNSTTTAVQRVGVLTPVTIDHAGVQAALDAAAPLGLRVQAAGEYTTDQTLAIRGDCDLSRLTIRYVGTGTAARLGSPTESTMRREIIAPRVVNYGKTETGWAQAAGTVGYDMVNVDSCRVTATYAHGFEVGLLARGAGRGCAYNTVQVGHLYNNKVNHKVTADATGWSNQNVYIGGRLSHVSGEGTQVADVRHIFLENTASVPNNNTWLNTSIEGVTPEIHAEIAGLYNVFLNVRWEVGGAPAPRVHWAEAAGMNQILWGYTAQDIVETRHANVGRGNQILTGTRWKVTAASGYDPTLWLENDSTVTGLPVVAITDAGSQRAGEDVKTAYTWRWDAKFLEGKRKTDSHNRVRLDAQSGRLYLGSGTEEPPNFILGAGTATLFAGSTEVGALTDGGTDLGKVSAYRFNYIRAKTATVTGAFTTANRPTASAAGVGASIFDTTLGKPVWSTGTRWVDSTGATA